MNVYISWTSYNLKCLPLSKPLISCFFGLNISKSESSSDTKKSSESTSLSNLILALYTGINNQFKIQIGFYYCKFQNYCDVSKMTNSQ